MDSFLPVSIVILMRSKQLGLELWTQMRQEQGPLHGLMEFPGGKREEGESAKDCALREFEEEVGPGIITKEDLGLFSILPYLYKDRRIVLHAFVAMKWEQDPPLEKGRWLFIPFDEDNGSWREITPKANHELIENLCKKWRQNSLESLTHQERALW